MKIRTRIAAVIVGVAMLFGLGAATEAQAGTVSGSTPNNACVVIPPAKVAVCLGRF
ncbi:MAG TPA: hypothetical protein VFV00_15620 [Acidimicrobiales bacterium]|nr:hypothetical protein [Acidimicrobiales bacterium]